ncbi:MULTISPECIES: YuzB family protein [Paenibacillus]|uniref:YuzB family protein n=1 Tax=Paenibacillus oceani TaxID=2772510 RepID=A0A927CIQ4_9BACL|nr:YuzB family protein [Paenibacillus oceani]MBD2866916.1 YuzB family protein [Paenibacillus oceani]MDF2658284.1 UDP-N-acetylmuramoylalanine--D-glutamate ligase [Paenibacillus sp.]
MRPIVEFCTNNMHHGTDAVMRELEQNPDIDVIEYGCLGNCGQCYMEPYALVNGEIVPAETADELLQAILHKIEQWEKQFDWLDE